MKNVGVRAPSSLGDPLQNTEVENHRFNMSAPIMREWEQLAASNGGPDRFLGYLQVGRQRLRIRVCKDARPGH